MFARFTGLQCKNAQFEQSGGSRLTDAFAPSLLCRRRRAPLYCSMQPTKLGRVGYPIPRQLGHCQRKCGNSGQLQAQEDFRSLPTATRFRPASACYSNRRLGLLPASPRRSVRIPDR